MTTNENDLEAIIKEEKRKYFKEWREKNKEKVKQSNANYWRRRAERIKALQSGEGVK